MAAGLGVLRLSPRDFWTMTPRELAAAIEGLNGGPASLPLGRGELMQLFPDTR